METLSQETVIRLKSGEAVIKNVVYSAGKQIYRVIYDGTDKMLVWIPKSKEASSIYSNTLKLVQMGCIDESYIWPEDISELDDSGFGYIVPIIPDGFVPHTDIFYLKYRPDYRVIVTAAIQLCKAIESLSQNGLVKYGFTSFYVNVNDGRIIIPDNDEAIVPYGTKLSWFDNPRYTAPEVTLGAPLDCYSMRFILAKLLFQLLFLAHPFEGVRSFVPRTTNMQIKLYAEDPVFIFDRNDQCNMPDPSLQKNTILLWKRTPTFVKEIFWRAFDKEAIRQPLHRPTEKDFSDVLIRYLVYLNEVTI